jgi:hypothetical protein
VCERRKNFGRVKYFLYLSPQLEVIPHSEVDSIVVAKMAEDGK